MKLYEGLFLFDANQAAKDWPGLEKHVGDLLTKNEAELVYSERWPDRKLSYEVKGCRKGTYFLTYFNAPGPSITALHRDVQLSERVLRLMVLQNEYIEEVLETHKTRQAEREAAAEEKAKEAKEAPAKADTPEPEAVASVEGGGDEAATPGGEEVVAAPGPEAVEGDGAGIAAEPEAAEPEAAEPEAAEPEAEEPEAAEPEAAEPEAEEPEAAEDETAEDGVPDSDEAPSSDEVTEKDDESKPDDEERDS